MLRLGGWCGLNRRAAREVATLLALTAIPLLWGAAESGMLTFDAPAPTTHAAPPTTTSQASNLIAVEGSIVLTESPAGTESSGKSRSKSAVSASRSGLTNSSPGPTIINLVPTEDEFGADASSIFPALPSTKKMQIKRAPSGTYRTLCVRLCDGYYWPVSFSTTRDGLGEDKETCEASCGVPVKLFYYRNPDGQPEDAVDLKGEPYVQLANAFRYRSEYVSQCKCQPDPWEAASLDRHKQYAMLAQAGKLALYDNRKPKKRRKKGADVTVIAVAEDVWDESGLLSETSSEPKTTITSLKRSNQKATLAVRKKNSGQVSFGAAMGVTKIGQSASGKKYSAKKAGITQSRK